MARGDVRAAESFLEQAAQGGRDAQTLMRLATVRRALGNLPGALQCAASAVELEPRNFLMCLLLGSLRETMGASHAAERAYRTACEYAPGQLPFQPAITRQLDSARRWVSAASRWRERLYDWTPSDGQLSPDEERRMRGFRASLLKDLDSGPLRAPEFLVPGIASKTYFDPASFRGVAEVERGMSLVRAEFLALAEAKDELRAHLSGLHGPEDHSGRSGAWAMIPLIRAGEIVEEFAARCPRTMELARGLDLPRLAHISPSLYFSVLEPGSVIPPHTGLTNARAIAHFPLIVPDNCGFRVGGETRLWSEGEVLIFDDMTIHEAWNESDSIRVVLIADLWRPELSIAERAAVAELLDWPV